MPIDVTRLLKDPVEKVFIGFTPESRSVKPVHVANGLFRTVLGAGADTGLLVRTAFYQTARGEVPLGHGLHEVYEYLAGEDRLDRGSIATTDLAAFRRLLKKLLSADDGVFMFKNDELASYTAGNERFVSSNRIAQDSGELRYCQ